MNKYHNQPTQIDNLRFASLKEARRYQELKILLNAGVISGLEMQPVYPLAVNGTTVGKYYADFRYIDVETGKQVIEDTKGMKTQVYNLKKKMVKAIYGIEIQEV